MSQEDLQENEFFQFLQTHKKCASIYANAGKENYIICVPVSPSLSGARLSLEFVQSHVFVEQAQEKPPTSDPKALALLEGSKPKKSIAPVTILRSLNGKVVSITDGSVSTRDGYPSNDQRTATILFEELCYSEDFESYRVLCLDVPLVGRVPRAYQDRITSQGVGKGQRAGPFPVERRSQRGHAHFLRIMLGRSAQSVMESPALTFFVSEFTLSAMNSLRASVPDTADKVRSACALVEDEALAVVKKKQKVSQLPRGLTNELSVAVAAHVNYRLHGTLFTALRKLYQQRDQALHARIKKLYSVTMQQLGVSEHALCSPGSAIKYMQSLNKEVSPLGKLCCLQDVDRKMMQAVAKAQAQDDQGEAMAADDVLPLLVFIIVKANPGNLWANLTYMLHFCPWEATMAAAGAAASQLRLLHTQMEAAVRYLETADIEVTEEEDTSAGSPPQSSSMAALLGADDDEETEDLRQIQEALFSDFAPTTRSRAITSRPAFLRDGSIFQGRQLFGADTGDSEPLFSEDVHQEVLNHDMGVGFCGGRGRGTSFLFAGEAGKGLGVPDTNDARPMDTTLESLLQPARRSSSRGHTACSVDADHPLIAAAATDTVKGQTLTPRTASPTGTFSSHPARGDYIAQTLTLSALTASQTSASASPATSSRHDDLWGGIADELTGENRTGSRRSSLTKASFYGRGHRSSLTSAIIDPLGVTAPADTVPQQNFEMRPRVAFELPNT